tara:strand:- start:1901 stop:4183 length:2283 start_codon:yes stop_codon:yes gene_type:complete
MATTVDTLLIRIDTDMKGVRKDLQKLEQRTKQSTDKMNKSFAGVGKVFKLAVAVAIVAGVARATGALIKLASDAQEMQAKSSVVFGAYTNDVRLFSQNLARDVGRSSLELEGMAASVQDTFVPMGFSRREGAELSKTLTKLAVDVGSFNNKADAEVMRAFQSALVGNHETLRQFGVVITEATIKQELLNMGVQGGTKAATEQEKVQARLNLLMRGTTDAQGDAARTADSFANRVKALQGQLADLGARLGETLLPVATKVVEVFSEIVETIENVLLKLGIIAPTAAEAIVNKLQSEKTALITAKKDLKDLLETKPEAMDLPPNNQLNNPILQGIIKNNPSAVELYEKSTGGDLTQAKIMADQKNLKGVLDNIHLSRIRAVQREIELLHQKITLSERQRIADERALKIQEQRVKMEAERAKLLDQQADPRSRNKLTDRGRRKLDEMRSLAAAGSVTDMSRQGPNFVPEPFVINAATQAQLTFAASLVDVNDIINNSINTYKEAKKAQFDKVQLTKAEIEETMRLEEIIFNMTAENGKYNHNQLRSAKIQLRMHELRKRDIALTHGQAAALAKLQIGLEETREAQAKYITDFEAFKDKIKGLGDSIGDALAKGLMEGKISLSSFADIFRSFIADMIADVIKLQVIRPIFENLFGGFNLGSIFAGVKAGAGGGSMSPNRPHLVGERGPELFVPSGAGTLMNNMNTKNAMGGGGMVINQSINVSTGVAQTVRAEIANLLPAIRNDTMRAVADGKRRGGSFAKAIG